MYDYNKAKKAALKRRRRIIYDNDGCDATYYCENSTDEEVLRSMMVPLIGTQVDSVSCATMSSGLGQFTHLTKLGSLFTSKEGNYSKNITADLAGRGTDHLKIKIDFCRKHNLEVFWQMRMNDTHDGADDTLYGPIIYKNNAVKAAHPEYMVAKPHEKTQCGYWSAMDFALKEVRDLAFGFVGEVCENYDIDGVNLDFFRHPVFFKSTSRGEKASVEETDMMTGLVRKIARMMEQISRRQEKALLLAVRVPDSTEYCRAIGLDIEKWLEEGLVDILITTSYIHMNGWEYSVNLGRKYNVKVYPSLDEARIKEPEGRAERERPGCYRARAANALAAGMDGIYLFNYKSRDVRAFGADSERIFSEIGSLETLSGKNKTYFASYRGLGEIAGGGYPHAGYVNIPVLNPKKPIEISYGSPCVIDIVISEKEIHLDEDFTLSLRFSDKPDAGKPEVLFNGASAVFLKTDGQWSHFALKRRHLAYGKNRVSISFADEKAGPYMLLDLKAEIINER